MAHAARLSVDDSNAAFDIGLPARELLVCAACRSTFGFSTLCARCGSRRSAEEAPIRVHAERVLRRRAIHERAKLANVFFGRSMLVAWLLDRAIERASGTTAAYRYAIEHPRSALAIERRRLAATGHGELFTDDERRNLATRALLADGFDPKTAHLLDVCEWLGMARTE